MHEGEQGLVDGYKRCGMCRYFDAEDQMYMGDNRCRCVIDGREHWKGDDARLCGNYDGDDVS